MSLSSQQGHVSLQALEGLVRAEGFEQFGFAELSTPVSIGIYEEWLKKGYQGEMSYLERHLPEKREPEKLLRAARSAIVLTKNYVPHPEPRKESPVSEALRTAAYARGRDYHHFLKERLERVMAQLREMHPQETFVAFTDSAPVLERDLASRAGLGWIGKNTCLLSRQEGSLFFIAEIYTTLSLPAAKLSPHDHCGTCTRCLDACPTGALVAPRELDARKCISYLTIESREIPDESLRSKMGDWFFGCDICQTVCPWNIKVHKESLAALSSEDSKSALVADLRFILTSPNRALERAFAGTPLSRAGGVGLKRNALVVAANKDCAELIPEIETFLEHEKLGELAAWALRTLAPKEEPPPSSAP
jgi:epoxyqueuosine reductase